MDKSKDGRRFDVSEMWGGNVERKEEGRRKEDGNCLL